MLRPRDRRGILDKLVAIIRATYDGRVKCHMLHRGRVSDELEGKNEVRGVVSWLSMTFFVFPWLEDVIMSSFFKYFDYANGMYFLSQEVMGLGQMDLGREKDNVRWTSVHL